MSLPEPPPLLYLDEHLSPRLAIQLRKYGFDVITVREVDMLAQSDADQLAFAVSQGRALVTFNVHDFVALHDRYLADGIEHCGMIFSTEETIGVLLHRLLKLLNSLSAEELRKQIRWLNEFK